jgi:hypothetical protein
MFPTNNPLPYSEAEFTSISIDSTPDDVIELLGQPQLKLQGDSIWVYGRTRAVLTDGVGGYEHDYRAILIEFSDGFVVSKDVLHEKMSYSSQQIGEEICWSKSIGLCLQPVWDSRSDAKDEPKILSRKYSAVISRRDDDVQAKRFISDGVHCAVYVYGFSSMPPSVTLDTIRDEPIPYNGYVYFQSLPRPLQLKAGHNIANIDCQAGSLHFYRISHDLFTAADDLRIKSVDPEEAKEVIRKQNLVVTW